MNSEEVTKNDNVSQVPISSEEKERIKADESLRLAVREKLVKNKPFHFWEQRDSPFVLWVLSSIVLGLLSLLYSGALYFVTTTSNHSDLRNKLNSEIGFRLYQAKQEIVRSTNTVKSWKLKKGEDSSLLMDATTENDRGFYESSGIYSNLLAYLNDEQPNLNYSIHPEFRSVRFEALINELKELDGDSDNQLEDAVTLYEEFAQKSIPVYRESDITFDAMVKEDKEALTEANGEIDKWAKKAEWKKGLFSD